MKEITTGSPPWDNDPVWDTTSTACLPQDRVTKNPSGEVKWVKVTQLCPTLWDPMDYTVHGILQARTLECIAIHSSRESSQPRDQTQVSHIAGGFFYQLSHQGSPRILQWVAYPFSRGSSRPRKWAGVACIVGGFLKQQQIICNVINMLIILSVIF